MINITNGSGLTVKQPEMPRIRVNNFPVGGTAPAGMWVGSGVPTTVPGALPEHEYLDDLTGDIYRLGADMGWTLVTNIKGAPGEPGDTEIDEDERARIVAAATDAVEANLVFDIDPVLLFENAMT